MRSRKLLSTALLVAGCAASPSSATGPAAGAGPLGSASNGSRPPPRAQGTPGPSRSASPGGASASASEVPALPPRARASGATRGTIACGDARCRAPAEACVADLEANAWRCEPRGDGGEVPPFAFACDDGTDCPQGETCCALWEEDPSTAGTQACVARRDVSQRCRTEVCVPGGARCPDHTQCVADDPNPDLVGSNEARCRPDPPRATCRGGAQCPAEAPVCIGTPAGYVCAKAGTPTYDQAEGPKYECTRQSDCHGGQRCMHAFGERVEMETRCALLPAGRGGSPVCVPGSNPCGPTETCACIAHDKALPWVGVPEAR